MTDDRNDPAQNNPAQNNPTQQFPTQPGAFGQRPQGQYGPAHGPNPYQQGNPYQRGDGYNQHATPQQHAAPTQHGATTTKARPGRATLVAGALALVLVGGGIGGAIGVYAAGGGNGAGGATNSLNSTITAAQPAANIADGSIQAVANKVLPSVVQIEVVGNQAEGEGSGVILSSDGLILTNNHVATGAGANGKLTVSFADGTTADATLVGADAVSDIAVIKAEGRTDLTPIELGSSSNLQV
ncbi:MAG: S1C family serine protease, partial [Rhodococcus sp. (in: high G+C Gram-positive bacteria)]